MAIDSARNVTPEEEEEAISPRGSLSLTLSQEEIRAVAKKMATEPVHPSDRFWGILSPISLKARQRKQGRDILFSLDEHTIGRCVFDVRFQINSLKISASHCRIYRDKESAGSNILKAFVKDTSTNGTYLNWNRLDKNMPASRLRHGDILAFVTPPHDGDSYAYVYREICRPRPLENGSAILKRRREEVSSECKRQKGIGIGSSNGPVSLDDVRSLQRSNSDLRQQLESHVLTIETLRNGSRESLARHENEIKELKETISGSFVKQMKELEHALGKKHKELDLLKTVRLELESSIKDLNERLSASKQSCADADEIIMSQKGTISEIEKQLEEERKMRREEREKAAEDLKYALEKAQAEAKEESKRQANIYQREHKEQQEVITKLQECEKETRLLVGTLRSKLEDARENLIVSEKKVRQLESQLQDEQLVSTNSKKISEALESELRSLKAELENEKVAREEAWAKVSALELEISAAIRDLSIEKQRFQGARERLILRETQLRAFYSTTEEISALFAKQQEQLKAMQRTLEDEEHYENTLTCIDLNQMPSRKVNTTKEDKCPITSSREVSGKCLMESNNTGSSDEGDSTTEKNGDGNDTQGHECTSANQLVKGFGSNGDGGVSVSIAAAHVNEQTDAELVLETESQGGDGTLQKCCNMEKHTMQLDEEIHPVENFTEPVTGQALERTSADQLVQGFGANVDGGVSVDTTAANVKEHTDAERVLETESQPGDGTLQKYCNTNIEGDTMQLDEETHPVENLTEPVTRPETEPVLEDTEPGEVQTADLITSEAVGSWAVSTAPLVNAGSESLKEAEDVEAVVADALICLGSQTSGSQGNKGNELSKEQQILNAMITIVDPEFDQKFLAGGGFGKGTDISDAETEEGVNDDDSKDDTDDEDGGSDAMNEY
ncbi:SMAD/FHA domain-containing family protein [Rhynchospora pubera]|uniref:SMAD/FHA domain-containing family protein n=1 Tax=Rhynchospora pubera TaxID=906938 RepID=A0AAV8GDT9_9POAL|nr:SMAD/FHA domain-containing family protein [Rhynchospora pubera]